MLLYPFHSPAGILQLGGILVFRGQPVAKIYHRDASLGKTHTVVGVALAVTVDPAAAVDADDGGQGLFRALGAVNVQCVPYLVAAVTQSVEALNVIGGGEAFVTDIVARSE